MTEIDNARIVSLSAQLAAAERARDAARANAVTFQQSAATILKAKQDIEAQLAAEKARADKAEELSARLKLEAQCHAGEAHAANSTIYEIYQVLSGGKGEPGNWHGAEPAREYVRAAEANLLTATKAAREKAIEEAAQVADAMAAERQRMGFEEDRTEPTDEAEAAVLHGQAFIAKCIAKAIRALSPESKDKGNG